MTGPTRNHAQPLVGAAVTAIRLAQRDITFFLEVDRPAALQEVHFGWKDRGNITRVVDVVAEQHVRIDLFRAVRDAFGARFPFSVFGEETLAQDFDVSEVGRGVVALLDVIDGTDLFARDLANWCSAVMFYDAKSQMIYGAAVGDAFGRIYTAVLDQPTEIMPPAADSVPYRPFPSPAEHIEDAYIAFYGQKMPRLRDVLSSAPWLDNAKRIYNFGGNPMLLRLAEGAIDAVFEIKGQAAHDVVPGAYIAAQAGATVLTLSGAPLLGSPEIREALRFPARKTLRYVAAGSEVLARRVLEGFDF